MSRSIYIAFDISEQITAQRVNIKQTESGLISKGQQKKSQCNGNEIHIMYKRVNRSDINFFPLIFLVFSFYFTNYLILEIMFHSSNLYILKNQTLRESYAMERHSFDKQTPEYHLCGGTAGNQTWVP